MKTIEVRGCTQPTHQLKYIPQTLTCSELQGGHLCEKQTLQPPSESQIAVLGNNHVEHAENHSPVINSEQQQPPAPSTHRSRITGKKLTSQWVVMKGAGPIVGQEGLASVWHLGEQGWRSGEDTKGTAAGAAGVCWAGQPLGALPISSSSLCILCFSICV